MRESFEITHKDLNSYAKKEDFDIGVSGTTCVACVQNPEGTKLWIAWLGDSRLIFGSTEELKFETQDHKPEFAPERKRIESLGGNVREIDDAGFISHRIFLPGEEYPGLCMTRSFGDECLTPYGVTYVPQIAGPLAIDEGSQHFLFLASDGVWEFLTSQWVFDKINRRLEDPPKKITRYVVDAARRRWKREEGDYCDDITAILVLFGRGLQV